MKYSIIIPCYNIAKRAERLIEMYKINHNDCEIIFVDDCSLDGSFDILRKKIQGYDNYHVLKTEKNGGPGIARNVGIENAHGDYILFCDSDDFFDISIMDKLDEFINNVKSFDLIISPFFIQRGKRKKVCDRYGNINNFGEINKSDIVLEDAGPVAKVFKFDIIIKNNLRFPARRLGEDKCFLVNYLVHAKKILKFDNVFYNYIMEKDSLTHSFKEDLSVPTVFELLKPIYDEYFSNEILRLFANDYLLAKAKDMVNAKCSNKEIHEFFKKENEKYPNWIADINMKQQSLYRKLIYKAMAQSNEKKIKFIINLRNILY